MRLSIVFISASIMLQVLQSCSPLPSTLRQKFVRLNDTIFVSKKLVTNGEFMLFVNNDQTRDIASYFAGCDSTNHGRLAFNDPYVSHQAAYPGFRDNPIKCVEMSDIIEFMDWTANQLITTKAMHNIARARLPTLPEYRRFTNMTNQKYLTSPEVLYGGYVRGTLINSTMRPFVDDPDFTEPIKKVEWEVYEPSQNVSFRMVLILK